MKKFVALGLSLMLTVSLIGCGSEEVSKEVTPESSSAVVAESTVEAVASSSEEVKEESKEEVKEEVKAETKEFTEEYVKQLIEEALNDNYIMRLSMTMDDGEGNVINMDDVTVVGKSGEDTLVTMTLGAVAITEYKVGGQMYASYTYTMGDETETYAGKLIMEDGDEDLIGSAADDYTADTFEGFTVEPIDDTHCKLIYDEDTDEMLSYVLTVENGQLKEMTADQDGQLIVMKFEKIKKIELPVECVNSTEEITSEDLAMALFAGMFGSMNFEDDDVWEDDDFNWDDYEWDEDAE